MTAGDQDLRAAVEEICERLCVTVDGDFGTPLQVASDDLSAQKLGMLVNFLLDNARRAIAERERAITDLRQMQQELVDQEKLAALGRLVAGVAHEINTPLGSALTASTVLGRRTNEFVTRLSGGKLTRSEASDYCATAQEAVRLIEGNLARAAELVASFKRVAADQTSEQRRRFLLADYLRDIAAGLSPRLKQTPHRLEVDCPPDLHLDTVAGALAQVVTNLVINSLVHAFPDGRSGRILLRVRDGAEGSVEIDCEDDGVGVPADLRKKIFEPFFTTRRDSGGTGLGLHIVYNLVTTVLGGSIGVEEAPAGGSRFRLRLPKTLPGDRTDRDQPNVG